MRSFGQFKPDPKPDPKPKKSPKPIKKVSDKHGAILKQYAVERKIFLSMPENQKCFIAGCNKKATTIEHTRGKRGYFDEEARRNDMPLYLDQRFWKPCCWEHNTELENNPALSKQYQKSKIHKGDKI